MLTSERWLGEQVWGGHWGEIAASDQTGSPDLVQSILPGNAGGATRWTVALCLKEPGALQAETAERQGKGALPLLPEPLLYK